MQLETENASANTSIKEEDMDTRSKIESLVLRVVPNEIGESLWISNAFAF